MGKLLLYTLSTIFFAPYFGAYVLSHLLKLEGVENMPTIKEWFGFIEEEWKNVRNKSKSFRNPTHI